MIAKKCKKSKHYIAPLAPTLDSLRLRHNIMYRLTIFALIRVH